MSFDIYLQCVAGDPVGVSRSAVRSLFPIDEKSEPDYWSVFYDRLNSCKINVTASKSDNELITSLSANRPCGDVRFWEAVLAILRMGPVILYWPGGGPLVGNNAIAADLPPEIVESLGQARAVGTAQEIMDAIRES